MSGDLPVSARTRLVLAIVFLPVLLLVRYLVIPLVIRYQTRAWSPAEKTKNRQGPKPRAPRS